MGNQYVIKHFHKSGRVASKTGHFEGDNMTMRPSGSLHRKTGDSFTRGLFDEKETIKFGPTMNKLTLWT